MNIKEMDNCPECNNSFNRKDILEHSMEAKNNPMGDYFPIKEVL